jgi:hypothetical protein
LYIPKCGGDTVAHHFSQHGDPPFLLVADGGVLVNDHTPQHMTWSEVLRAGWNCAADFRVAALVRHPVERVMSEFNYLRVQRPDLLDQACEPSAFLEEFLSKDPVACLRFDNHNLSIHQFPADSHGVIDPRIEVCRTQHMEQLVQSFGLPAIEPSQRRNVTSVIAMIWRDSPWSVHGFSLKAS